MYKQYGGIVLDEDEGAHILKALGNKKVCWCTKLSHVVAMLMPTLQAVFLQVPITPAHPEKGSY